MIKKIIFSLIILLFAIFLRFYKIYDWMYFMIDEERDAFVVRRLLVERRPTLIGNAVPGGWLYLTPIYYYLSAIPMFFSRLDPLGWGVTASLLGTVLVFLVWKVGRELFGKKVAIMATVLYAISYLNVVQNRIYWPLMMPPLTALLSYYSLSKIIKGKKKYIWLLGIALTVGIGYDSSTISLFLLAAIVWWRHKLSLKDKRVVVVFLILLLAHLPLVIFDFRHNHMLWQAIKNFFSFSSTGGEINLKGAIGVFTFFPQVFSRLIYTAGRHDIGYQINPQPLYVAERLKNISLPALFLGLLSLGYLVVRFFKAFLKEKDHGIKFLFLHLVIAIFGIFLFNLFYPAYLHEWFFYTLFPACFYILALFFDFLWRQKLRVVVIVALLGVSVINVHAFLTGSNQSGLKNKVKAVKFAIEKTGGEDFYLDSLGAYAYGGYRYLFGLLGKEPTHSFMDAVYGDWFYPKPEKEVPSLGVVIVNAGDKEPDRFYQKYKNYLEKTKIRKSFDQLEVLIVREV